MNKYELFMGDPPLWFVVGLWGIAVVLAVVVIVTV